MNKWGLKPFCNDGILSDLGGFNSPNQLTVKIRSVLYNSGYYYAGYEVSALLVSTYQLGVDKNYIISKERMEKLVNLLDKHCLTKEEKELITENSKIWLSACAIPTDERDLLLCVSLSILDRCIKNASTGSDLAVSDKKILIKNMKEVYALGRNILATKNNKPAYIKFEKVSKLANFCKFKSDDIIPIVCCINKKYKGNKVVSFILQDKANSIMEVTPDMLKEALKNKKIECINLRLTADNKIISI